MSPETASVVAAAIAAVAAIGVAVVGVVGNRQHRHTRKALSRNTQATDEVLHQVRNDHGTNLRDDLDALAISVARHGNELARVESKVGDVRKAVREVADKQEAHDSASLMIVDELHKTDRALAREIAKHHPSK